MYQPFHCSRIGASHIKRGLPCQDSSYSEKCPEGELAVVADGHGNRKHFRSHIGSKIACEVAAREIRAFLQGELQEIMDLDLYEEPDMNQLMDFLKHQILAGWTTEVLAHFEENPWTEEELFEEEELLSRDSFEALVQGKEVLMPYGSTLLAVFAYEGGWAALQLGDGCFVKIGLDGIYDWPMPESEVNEGNKTASLCMIDPMRDFRHCFGADAAAGFMVVTDGIEKSFPPEGKEITSLLHWIWKNEHSQSEKRRENLAKTLDIITSRTSAGDDLSAAGLINLEAVDTEPKAGRKQKETERKRLLAQIAEVESTIRYNLERIAQARAQEKDTTEVEAQLEGIVERKKAAAKELWDLAEKVRVEIEGPEATSALPYECKIEVPEVKVQKPEKSPEHAGKDQENREKQEQGKGRKALYEMLEMWGKL